MKKRFTFALCLLAAAYTSEAQNQITTPSGQPLVIGNQGVKLANLNSGSATGTANGKVLTVDANGLLFLAPASSGGGGGTTPWATSGSTISYNVGNVGIGTSSPQQRLDVNGSINMPSGAAIRFNNVPFLSAPGSANTIIGESAAGSISSGAYNVFLGAFTGQQNTSASFNLFLGPYSGQNTTTGSNNFFGGVNAGKLNTTGQSNNFIGTGAGSKNTTGSLNTFIGPNAGASNTTASLNFFCGVSSGYDNTTGVRNLFLGYNSGRNSQSGNDNIMLGANAGGGLVSGSGNIFIGFNSKPSGTNAASLTNSIAIGTGSTVTTSNSLVLGSNTTNVGIGNTAPTAKFHITAGATIGTGVRMENLPDETGTTYPLSVDASGNIMKSNVASGARISSLKDNNWKLDDDGNLSNSNDGKVIIGVGISKIPDGYRMLVSDGIMTEKVKVALKNTAEWADHVFEPTYKLPSLMEVEKFIKKNKHLEGIPSASKMVLEGNDLNRTDAILLEKIEQLTLYMIELSKENKELKLRVEELEK